MKKFLTVFGIVAMLSVSAQSTAPRFGTTASRDNTGRILTYGATTITPSGTLVTVTAPNRFENHMTVASTSIAPTFTVNVTNAYFGDKIHLYILAEGTGSRVATFSTNIIAPTSTIAIPADKKAHAHMVFDGAKFILLGTAVEP